MMKKERFLKLLSRKLLGELSIAESEILDKAIESNEEYKMLANEIVGYFDHRKEVIPKKDQLEQVWKMIRNSDKEAFIGNFNYLEPKEKKLTYISLLKIAAVLVLFIGAGIVGYNLLNRVTDQNFNSVVATDEKIFKIMDDGTKIWLNKKSAITYSAAFGKHKREIFLEGEAYFDVAVNKAVPLFIHAGNIDIEVKGTAFNVNAYKEKSQIQVALIRGAIQVTDRRNNNHKVLLRPNQKLIFSNVETKEDHQDFLVLPLASNILLSDIKWTLDTLTFNKEKLKDLTLRLEKKYDVKIEIRTEQLKEKRFSGVFVNETIEQALEALKLSYPLTYTISNRLVVIKD